MEGSSEVQQLLDIEAIKRLKALYCHCVAIEDWKTFETLFTEDLQFISPNGMVREPRSGFMAFHRENIQIPKLWGVIRCYTPIITLTGTDTAEGIWGLDDLHIWPGNDEVRVGHRGYGHYYEKYVRMPEGWRFKQIKVEFERMEPLEGGFGSVPAKAN